MSAAEVPRAPVGPRPVPADPWAALRVPLPEARDAQPIPVPTPIPVPNPAPPTAPVVAAGVAPLPVVRTFPTSYDGSSGTIWDQPYGGDGQGAAREIGRPRRGLGARIAAFVRSFWEQPESYHSPKAGPEIPPHPREHELAPLPNYGRAALVMLSACGVAIGAYLPWISGTIDTIAFERTGYEQGHAWGFTWAAAAFTIAAILGARHKVFGWVTMAMSVVVAALVAHQLLDVHDAGGGDEPRPHGGRRRRDRALDHGGVGRHRPGRGVPARRPRKNRLTPTRRRDCLNGSNERPPTTVSHARN